MFKSLLKGGFILLLILFGAMLCSATLAIDIGGAETVEIVEVSELATAENVAQEAAVETNLIQSAAVVQNDNLEKIESHSENINYDLNGNFPAAENTAPIQRGLDENKFIYMV